MPNTHLWPLTRVVVEGGEEPARGRLGVKEAHLLAHHGLEVLLADDVALADAHVHPAGHLQEGSGGRAAGQDDEVDDEAIELVDKVMHVGGLPEAVDDCEVRDKRSARGYAGGRGRFGPSAARPCACHSPLPSRMAKIGSADPPPMAPIVPSARMAQSDDVQ